MELILFSIWAMIGIGSVVFWWTDQQPLHKEDLVMAVLAGSLLGAFAFLVFALPLLIGWKGRNPNVPQQVLMKQRGSKKHMHHLTSTVPRCEDEPCTHPSQYV